MARKKEVIKKGKSLTAKQEKELMHFNRMCDSFIFTFASIRASLVVGSDKECLGRLALMSELLEMALDYFVAKSKPSSVDKPKAKKEKKEVKPKRKYTKKAKDKSNGI